MVISAISRLAALVLVLPVVAGCCCMCRSPSLPPGTFDVSPETNNSATGETTDMESARKFAQKALNTKGYGDIQTVNLQKDGLNWYVSGTADGLNGGPVNYEVHLLVTEVHIPEENKRKQNFAVQTISIDGEIVFP